MANSNLSHLDDHEKNTSENSFSEFGDSSDGDYKIFVPNVDQIYKEDRIHLLLDMPGLDEASCEIELIPGRVTVYGKLIRFSSSYDTVNSTNRNHGLLRRMRNERSQQFQYFFDIPVGFEDLQHAQFVEGTLHICVDRFEFPDPNVDACRSIN